MRPPSSPSSISPLPLSFLVTAAALGLAACFSDPAVPARSDPYAGMTCEEKIAAITGEIQAYQASQAPAAKSAARPSDTVQPDTVNPDTGRASIGTLRGWPPVAGLDPRSPGTGGVVSAGADTGNAGSGSYPGVGWIPPVGFGAPVSDAGSLPVTPDPSPDTASPSALPASISALQVVSVGAYRARVRILDFREALVREFEQDFGYRGELENPGRKVPGGLVSYLVWDGKDASGREATSGVYLWKVRIEPESRPAVESTSKTGYIGPECRQAR
jgi:hypothetical protein